MNKMTTTNSFTIFFPTVDPSQIEPSTGWQEYQINAHIMRTMRTENLRRCLPSMLAFAADTVTVTAHSAASSLVDPFDVADRLVFQCTMSAAGFDDVRAASASLAVLGPTLLRKIEGSPSSGRVLVPWLRTPGYRRRVAAMRKLAGYMGDAVRESERGVDGVLGVLMGKGLSMGEIVTVGFLFLLFPCYVVLFLLLILL